MWPLSYRLPWALPWGKDCFDQSKISHSELRFQLRYTQELYTEWDVHAHTWHDQEPFLKHTHTYYIYIYTYRSLYMKSQSPTLTSKSRQSHHHRRGAMGGRQSRADADSADSAVLSALPWSLRASRYQRRVKQLAAARSIAGSTGCGYPRVNWSINSIWVWVKIRYPNNWMVNTKLD